MGWPEDHEHYSIHDKYKKSKNDDKMDKLIEKRTIANLES